MLRIISRVGSSYGLSTGEGEGFITGVGDPGRGDVGVQAGDVGDNGGASTLAATPVF